MVVVGMVARDLGATGCGREDQLLGLAEDPPVTFGQRRVARGLPRLIARIDFGKRQRGFGRLQEIDHLRCVHSGLLLASKWTALFAP